VLAFALLRNLAGGPPNDARLRHRLTKAVPLNQPEVTLQVITAAELLLGIPPDQFDFDRAKADLQRQNPLGPQAPNAGQ
jgi:hypothetical protein